MNLADHWGFTGTRNNLTGEQHAWLQEVLPGDVVVHHGACVGADSAMHVYAMDKGNDVVVHPPTNPRLRMAYDPRALWLPAKDYLDRDRDIVDAVQLLLATPDGPERWQSGTWYTVRYAVSVAVPVFICYPDGTVEEWRPSPPRRSTSPTSPTQTKPSRSTKAEVGADDR
ncbi:hypothetical protein A5630_25230 [Mycolicibacterium mucogenicum]|uniref:Uncharacterized protein n=1 Tax=Mycolicibacterium mucogenicum TaxID=56689 RepID=A0A1A3GY07_MYCMU|nr:hypothetical protein [Mycolicibacterium mucogenicum]OBJ40256.1 hypothetical protein A5630_25230 [Mycolicibacterium mucogenicum]